MGWEEILKSRPPSTRRNSFPKKNLPLIKRIIEEIYMSIPKGTEFSARDYYSKFIQMVESEVPKKENAHGRSRFTHWVNKNALNWFTNFFPKYGINRNYIVRESGGKRVTFRRI